VRGHRLADPVIIGDVVLREQSRASSDAFSLNRGAGERLPGGDMVGLNDLGHYCSIGSA
jgi:hypothetical protein